MKAEELLPRFAKIAENCGGYGVECQVHRFLEDTEMSCGSAFCPMEFAQNIIERLIEMDGTGEENR